MYEGLISFLSWLWPIILVIFGFGVVIFVHELGHFLMARLVGIKVETFALGFGPRLFGFKRGQTDYSIRLLPLGGYVKMLGQEDLAIDQEKVLATGQDPASFLAKTPGQRMLVISGGVVMNVIFAAFAFILVFMHGWKTIDALVGRVEPDSPAAKAGLQSGDRFVRIDGQKILHFNEVKLAIALSDPAKPVELELLRDGQLIHKTVTPRQREDRQFRQIGVQSARELEVVYPGLAVTGYEPLKKGDLIVKAGTVTPIVLGQVDQVLEQAEGRPVELLVKRTVDGQVKHVRVYKRAVLALPATEDQSAEASILGLVPRCKFLVSPEVYEYDAESERVQSGDVIIRIENIANPSKNEALKYFGTKQGETVECEVLREGKKRLAKLEVPKKDSDFIVLTQSLGVDEANPILADTVAEAKKMNIPRGARIVSCAGEPVKNWMDIIDALKSHPGEPLELGFELGDKKLTGTLEIPTDQDWRKNITYAGDLLAPPVFTTIKGKYPHQAVRLGLRETVNVIKMVYVTIQRVVIDHSIRAREIGGPILILHMGKKVASERDIYELLYYFALISANLAVVNFLPIPIVDGGLAVLIILEKIRGRALSARSTAIWQTAGLALILSIFVLVTINDIRRLIGDGF